MDRVEGGRALPVRAHRGRFKEPSQGSFVSWRGARVAEGARLEIVCTERYRGFESLSLLRPPLRACPLPGQDDVGDLQRDLGEGEEVQRRPAIVADDVAVARRLGAAADLDDVGAQVDDPVLGDAGAGVDA